MSLTPCPDCGNMCSLLAASCPKCGRPFRASEFLQPAVDDKTYTEKELAAVKEQNSNAKRIRAIPVSSKVVSQEPNESELAIPKRGLPRPAMAEENSKVGCAIAAVILVVLIIVCSSLGKKGGSEGDAPVKNMDDVKRLQDEYDREMKKDNPSYERKR